MPADPKNEHETTAMATLPRGRARLLVAEDDEALRLVVIAKLEDDGHEVVEATSANALFAILTEPGAAEFDLLVLDHRMSGIFGLSILRELRALGRDIPAILMTAFPSPELLAEARAIGVSVLAKPFPLAELGARAQQVLAEHRHVEDAER